MRGRCALEGVIVSRGKVSESIRSKKRGEGVLALVGVFFSRMWCRDTYQRDVSVVVYMLCLIFLFPFVT